MEACKTSQQHLIGSAWLGRQLAIIVPQFVHHKASHLTLHRDANGHVCGKLSRFTFRVEFLDIEVGERDCRFRCRGCTRQRTRWWGEGDLLAVFSRMYRELFPDAPTPQHQPSFSSSLHDLPLRCWNSFLRPLQKQSRSMIACHELLVNLQGNRVDEVVTLAALCSSSSSLHPLLCVCLVPTHPRFHSSQDKREGEAWWTMITTLYLLTPLQPLTSLPSHVDVHRASSRAGGAWMHFRPALRQIPASPRSSHSHVIKGFGGG